MNPDILLGVNIDHVATLREARKSRYPSIVDAARVAERAGADAITVHLREDRRHIQDRDVELLVELVETRVNLELAVTDDMLAIAERLTPADVCLVPERREELTTEGGLDVIHHRDAVKDACARLAEYGIRVSLFIDAEEPQLEAARECGAPVVELHTGAYANEGTADELERIRRAAELGHDIGLQVNAGHGLNYHNVKPIAAIPQIRELNIGHAIVCQSVFYGLDTSIREMIKLMYEGRSSAL